MIELFRKLPYLLRKTLRLLESAQPFSKDTLAVIKCYLPPNNSTNKSTISQRHISRIPRQNQFCCLKVIIFIKNSRKNNKKLIN